MSYAVGFKLKVVELAEATSNRNAGKELVVWDWRKINLVKLPRASRVMRLIATPLKLEFLH